MRVINWSRRTVWIIIEVLLAIRVGGQCGSAAGHDGTLDRRMNGNTCVGASFLEPKT